ncbi:MAG TPA: hypothetical protein VLE47_03105 [Candidatus Saccharimonadales bacterium]|nr:hypothetical protein [Candidatus Saccharimonadales bacterium]
MEPASFIDPVALQEKAQEHKETLSQKLREILDDPKKTLYAMIGCAVVIALIFISWVYLSQSLQAKSTVKQQRSVKQSSFTGGQTNNSKGFDQRRTSDITQIDAALRLYRAKNRVYPSVLSALAPVFLASVPLDPETNKDYNYQPSLDLQSYTISATLSDGSDYQLSGN